MSLLQERDRLFAVIGALEEDLRDLIAVHLIGDASSEEVLGPAFARASQRQEEDSDAPSGSTILDYMDLGDAVDVLFRWRARLPADVEVALREVAEDLNRILPIRNRVMHRRPLLPDDMARAEALALKLSGSPPDFSYLVDAIARLKSDPQWSPLAIEDGAAPVLNNLPLVDFDETGLVGRQRETTRLARDVRALASSRTPVITVVGPGGVGKTALVLQVLHDLVNDPECPYELVSWVSLKSEFLSASGVQSIRDAVLTVEQAIPVLAAPLDDSFDGSVDALAEAVSGLRALIVIDNLETVSGQEIIELIDRLPEEMSYLFTSREGLGQLERRFNLESLDLRSGVDLLRRSCRARGLGHLARMQQEDAERLVDRLNRLPLGIRWYVAAVEAGKDPMVAAGDQADLLRFCVENVYQSLGSEARQVADVLHLVSRPLSIQELHLFLQDVGTDELRRSIHELLRRMLVTRDSLDGSLVETFASSEVLDAYIKAAKSPDPVEMDRVRGIDQHNRAVAERHRRDAARDPLRPNIIQGSEHHMASVVQLRQALSTSKRGDFDDALEILRTVEALDPEFWEIFRVRGFILSHTGDVLAANAAYERAINLAPTADARAAVQYFYAGHLSRVARDPEGALAHARSAHDTLGEARTAIELGRIYTFLENFGEAEGLLRLAVDAEQIHTRLIARTGLIDCLRRRAEMEAGADRRPELALETLGTAVDIAERSIDEGLTDAKLYEEGASCASDALRAAAQLQQIDQRGEAVVQRACSFLTSASWRLSSPQLAGFVLTRARRLLQLHPGLVQAVPELRKVAEAPVDEEYGAADDAVRGTLKVWYPDRNFGFVLNETASEEYFLHLGELSDPADQIFLRRGVPVEFTPATDNRGRLRATQLLVRDRNRNALRDRVVRVERVAISKQYLFARDRDTGATVFVGRHSAARGQAWDACETGDHLQVEVEVDGEGRFAARSTSFVVLPES